MRSLFNYRVICLIRNIKITICVINDRHILLYLSRQMMPQVIKQTNT